VPAALSLIVRSAFSPQAAFGAAIGIGVQQAIRFGVARGVLSNESGLGSAAIAHGAARTRYPVAQGSIAMMGTFIDTIVVCTLTALAITVSGAYELSTFLGGQLQGSDLTVEAFNAGLPAIFAGWGGSIVVVASLIFGFTTLIGWSYYGQICLEYLFGLKVIRPYRLIYLVLLFVGSLFTGKHAPIVTNVGDIGNALMAFPNLIGLILLSGVVRKMTFEAYAKNDLHVCEASPIEARR
jgi:AGCS family alanine or glycine:cation symporter